MTKILQMTFAIALVLCVVWAIFPATPVAADGLRVEGALADLQVTPGQTYVHKMKVSLSATLPGLDLLVEAKGYGQTLEGATQSLASREDQSRYSARQYIAEIDKPKFHLEPGTTEEVVATISVPNDIGPDPRYAVIYIHSEPAGEGPMGFVLAASVPVVLTPKNAKLADTGQIERLEVAEVTSGQPIEISTVLRNSGNHHYRAQNQITLFDRSGKQISTVTTPPTAASIIPTQAREFKVSPPIDAVQSLQPGQYQVESVVTAQDGGVLDKKRTTFELAEPYQPFVGIDEASLVIVKLSDEEPGTIDAMQKAGVILSFSGTGKVTGTVAIAKYKEEPPGGVPFSTSSVDGGLGNKAARFIALRVDGFDQGTAHVTARYQKSEVDGLSLNSLLLGFRRDQRWSKLGNIAVFTGAETVGGDLSVSALLGGTVVGLGGVSAQPTAASSGLPAINADLAAAILGVMILATIVVLVVVRPGRRAAKRSTRAGQPAGAGLPAREPRDR